MVNCPLCGAYSAGQIGRKRYYCGECCHEWIEKDGELQIFRIKEDGALIYRSIFPLRISKGA